MSTRVWSEKKSRWYDRKFDHDEARRRVRCGESIASLACEYGVSRTAIARIVDPVVDARMRAKTRAYYLAVCDECRGPCLSNNHPAKRAHTSDDGRTLCADCRSRARRTSVHIEHGHLIAIKCESCHEWFDPDDFSGGRRFRDLRPDGFHQACRGCNTRLRQDYRERHKIPCDNCGKPRLPASEKSSRLRDSGLCRDCWIESVRKTQSIEETAAA